MQCICGKEQRRTANQSFFFNGGNMKLKEMSISELIAYKEACTCYGTVEDVAECMKLIREKESEGK